VMSTLVGGVHWFGRTQDAVFLSVLPYFHVTGMAGGMNGPLYIGGTIVILPRWDRDAAAMCMQRYRVTVWQVISTMMIDFLSNPKLDDYDLSSLQGIRGGGAAMPQAIAAKLKEKTGLDYVEGYGMSETMAATHINPPQAPKQQCLGIPVFDVDSRVVDPSTLQEVPQGETGEIIVHGPQIMRGYWQRPEADVEAFVVDAAGTRWLRTGDVGTIDDDGFIRIVDRLKDMIAVGGFKVFPSQIEALLYRHPAVKEALVIGLPDTYRGEMPRAYVTLGDGAHCTGEQLRDWLNPQLGKHERVDQVVVRLTMPKTMIGKLSRKDLVVEVMAEGA